MGLYDNYQLANSQLTKQYAGSSVPALLNVGQVLEGRFDAAREGYDNRKMAIDNSKIYEGDRKVFNQVMDTHLNEIDAAAKAGNYEDMLYAANKGGKQFANDYRPFAENYQAIQGYYADVDKQLEKGWLKSPETAEKLKALGMDGYTGLTKDPNTGKLVNRFSGRGIAKEIDVPQKIDEWMKNFAPRTIGSSVEKIDGNYYVTKQGKRTTLTQVDIDKVLKSAMELDPEWKAYKDQKKAIDSMGYDRASVDSLEEGPLKTRIMNLAKEQGVSPQKAFKQIKEGAVESELASQVSTFASKYVRNDSETSYGIDETEVAARAAAARQKKADDQETVFGVPIVIPKTGTEFNTPEKLTGGITASNENMKKIGEMHSAWIKTHNITQKNGKYTMPNGVDVTNQAMQHTLILNQERNKRAQLMKLDNTAKAASRYDVNVNLQKEAKAAYTKAFNAAGSGAENRHGGVPEKRKHEIGQEAYDGVLKSDPKYGDYKKKLAELTENMSMETIATRFQDKNDNIAIETMMNNMATSDGDASLIGMEHVGSQKGGQQFTKEDFEKVKGKIGFTGQFMNDKGEQAYIFKATGEKGESIQFQTKGLVSNKSMPKLIGADAQQFYSQQFLRSATANPSGRVTTQIDEGTQMTLSVPTSQGGRYRLELNDNGAKKEWYYNSENEITSKISKLIKTASE